MSRKPLALSVRILLFNPEGQVLLLQRSKRSKTNPGKWELPGGKIDPGEPFDTALAREMSEETGLTVRILHAAGTAEQQVPGWHVIHLVMTGEIVSGTIRVSDEHEEFRWVAPDRLAQMDLADWCTDYAKQMARIPGFGGGDANDR
ncbi:MAG: NUDIX domain-containing protein [Methanoregula sp.]|jgi:8-oxo-dGTP diphosphatase